MVTLVKTWATDINNAFSSAVNQQTQYREAVYNLHEWIQGMTGATREWSCDSVTASSADNITSTSDIVYGVDGTNILSYFVYNLGNDQRILVVCNETAADTTPQTIDIYFCSTSYALHGTPLSNRPVPADAARECAVISIDIIPWASPVAGYWNAWRSSSGDLVFCVKEASTLPAVGFIIASGTSPGNSAYHKTVFGYSGTDAIAEVDNPAYWRSHTAPGVAMSNAAHALSVASLITGWATGLDSASRVLYFGWVLAGITGSPENRCNGIWEDVYARPINTVLNERDSSDTDAWILQALPPLALPYQLSDAVLL